jgi:hypothetical protein
LLRREAIIYRLSSSGEGFRRSIIKVGLSSMPVKRNAARPNHINWQTQAGR